MGLQSVLYKWKKFNLVHKLMNGCGNDNNTDYLDEHIYERIVVKSAI